MNEDIFKDNALLLKLHADDAIRKFFYAGAKGNLRIDFYGLPTGTYSARFIYSNRYDVVLCLN